MILYQKQANCYPHHINGFSLPFVVLLPCLTVLFCGKEMLHQYVSNQGKENQ